MTKEKETKKEQKKTKHTEYSVQFLVNPENYAVHGAYVVGYHPDTKEVTKCRELNHTEVIFAMTSFAIYKKGEKGMIDHTKLNFQFTNLSGEQDKATESQPGSDEGKDLPESSEQKATS